MIKIHFKKARFLPALQGIAFSVNSFISVSVTAFSVLVVFNVAAMDNNTVSAKDSVDFNQAFIHGKNLIYLVMRMATLSHLVFITLL